MLFCFEHAGLFARDRCNRELNSNPFQQGLSLLSRVACFFLFLQVAKPGLVSCKCKRMRYSIATFAHSLTDLTPKLTEWVKMLTWPTKSSALKLWWILKLRNLAFLIKCIMVWNLWVTLKSSSLLTRPMCSNLGKNRKTF